MRLQGSTEDLLPVQPPVRTLNWRSESQDIRQTDQIPLLLLLFTAVALSAVSVVVTAVAVVALTAVSAVVTAAAAFAIAVVVAVEC